MKETDKDDTPVIVYTEDEDSEPTEVPESGGGPAPVPPPEGGQNPTMDLPQPIRDPDDGSTIPCFDPRVNLCPAKTSK